VAVLAGDRFMVTDDLGDVVPGSALGLYAADTRFLSTYMLHLNGQRLVPLSARAFQRDAARFYATNGPATELQHGAVSLVREQRIDGVFHDDLLLTNHTLDALSINLTLSCAADFLDLFEVRQLDANYEPLACSVDWHGDQLVFTCREEGALAHTTLRFSAKPQPDDATARFEVHLMPQEEWRLHVEITPSADVREPRSAVPAGMDLRANQPLWRVPTLHTSDVALHSALEQAVLDLHSLEMISERRHRLVAAGLPWFVALFGRDTLLTAYQTLLFGPELAIGVLEALAEFQSTETDDFRDAEPGKMPHEVRAGRLARLGHVPHTRYYGTVDATILWLILLSETYRWTGDLGVVRQLWPAAEAALRWIDSHGDMDGDGFVEYARRSRGGLDNQGWKDSWDAIRFADGRLASGPIALVEVQGYVHDAKLRMAELFDALGEAARAVELRRQAAALKRAFNAAFWMPDQQYYALALDGNKRQVDSVTSNPGHALWSGIVDERHAGAIAARMISEEMFSGWGVRTMSARMKGYSPVAYHNGSIWPHDNALIAAGLARYGYGREAGQIISALVEASMGLERNRLPELFAGFQRRANDVPAPYPAASAPQAWAAGAVVLSLRTLLGIEPDGDRLISAALPGTPSCRLTGLHYRGREVSVGSG
jgi:glycogen debranching enzyme